MLAGVYREWATGVAGAVAWSRVVEQPQTHRILPDGCLDLIWSDGRLLVAGPDTVAMEMQSPAGRVYAGLRFRPGTGPSVFGVPASELRDSRVGLDEIWPRRVVRELTERVGEAPDKVGGAAGDRTAADQGGPGDGCGGRGVAGGAAGGGRGGGRGPE